MKIYVVEKWKKKIWTQYSGKGFITTPSEIYNWSISSLMRQGVSSCPQFLAKVGTWKILGTPKSIFLKSG